MFDSVGAFKKQFTAIEGGYLIYPSRRSGGKLITVDEYDRLVADWERIAGRAGLWKSVGILVLVVALWTLFRDRLSLPDWMDAVFPAVVALAFSARVFWASLAPRRLVKDRPAVTPARPASEAGREARAALNRPLIIFVLLLSAGTFFGAATASERTLSTWAWLVGSGLMLLAYLWIGFRKLMDRRR